MAGENNKIQELNMAYYVETMQHLGNVTFRIGGRYEHVNSEYFIDGRKITNSHMFMISFSRLLHCLCPLEKLWCS